MRAYPGYNPDDKSDLKVIKNSYSPEHVKNFDKYLQAQALVKDHEFALKKHASAVEMQMNNAQFEREQSELTQLKA